VASSSNPLAHTVESEESERLQALISAVAEEVPGLHSCHDLQLRPGADGYDVALHCLADPGLSIAEAHRLADQVEKRLHTRVPAIGQVLIHVEPEGKEGARA
jgi:divalent metal cation (Fe/Co/Zn/Cd) transporter